MSADIQDTPTPEQRHEMIAVAAYYLAELRGFAPGGADADWLQAERTIDRLIGQRRLRRHSSDDRRRSVIRNALVLGDGDAG